MRWVLLSFCLNAAFLPVVWFHPATELDRAIATASLCCSLAINYISVRLRKLQIKNDAMFHLPVAYPLTQSKIAALYLKTN